jgi:hypothetical protein
MIELHTKFEKHISARWLVSGVQSLGWYFVGIAQRTQDIWSASRSGTFTHEKSPSTNWTGSWLGSTYDMNAVGRRKIRDLSRQRVSQYFLHRCQMCLDKDGRRSQLFI